MQVEPQNLVIHYCEAEFERGQVKAISRTWGLEIILFLHISSSYF